MPAQQRLLPRRRRPELELEASRVPALGYEAAENVGLHPLPRPRLSHAARALALSRRVRAAPDRRDVGQGLRRRLDRPVPARPSGTDRPAPAAQLDHARPAGRRRETARPRDPVSPRADRKGLHAASPSSRKYCRFWSAHATASSSSGCPIVRVCTSNASRAAAASSASRRSASSWPSCRAARTISYFRACGCKASTTTSRSSRSTAS